MCKHIQTINNGETFEINGINILILKWESTGIKVM
jgi:hypothetical protein